MEDDIEKLLSESGCPMLDATDKNFKEDLAFNFWSTFSSSDYRNDKERPYDGQPHTDNGIRGMTEVSGLTMRDIRDCFVKAYLESCPIPSDHEYWKIFNQLYDEKGEPTQLLIDRQNDFPWVKVKLGTWREQDVFSDKLVDDYDPIAIGQNLTCEIEKMMNIYPNVPKLISHDDEKK